MNQITPNPTQTILPAAGSGLSPFHVHSIPFYTPAPQWAEICRKESPQIKPRTTPTGVLYSSLNRIIKLHQEEASLYVDYEFQVLNQIGLDRASDLRFQYFSHLETLEIHEISIHTEGKVYAVLQEDILVHQVGDNEYKKILSNEWVVQAILNHVEIGSRIRVRYSIHMNLKMSDNIFSATYGLVYEDIEHLVFHVILSDEYSVRNFRHSGPEPTWKEHNQIRWELISGKMPRYEDNTLSFMETIPTLVLSTAKSWDQISSFVSNYLNSLPELEISDCPKDLQALLQDSTNPIEDKIHRIVNWVRQKINYFSVTLNQSGYFPRPVQTVLFKRWGDCKDKSFLLQVLLKKIGIQSWLALVDSQRLGDTTATIPGLFFDHCILYIDAPRDAFFTDPSDPYPLDPRCLSSFCNRKVLLVGHSRLNWMQIDYRPEFQHHIESQTQYFVYDNRPDRIKIVTEFSQASSGKIFYQIESQGEDLKEDYRKSLEDLLGLELQQKSFKTEILPQKSMVVCKESYENDSLVNKDGLLDVSANLITSFLQVYFPQARRELPMILPPTHLKQTFVIHGPLLRRRMNHSEPIQAKAAGRAFELSIQSRISRDKVVYTCELKAEAAILSARECRQIFESLEGIQDYLLLQTGFSNNPLQRVDFLDLLLVGFGLNLAVRQIQGSEELSNTLFLIVVALGILIQIYLHRSPQR